MVAALTSKGDAVIGLKSASAQPTTALRVLVVGGILSALLVLGAVPAAAGLPAPQADLEIAKSDSTDPVEVGQQIVYTLVITNNGPSFDSVIVTDTLPTGVAFVSASPGCTYQPASVPHTVVCSADLVPPGSSATLTITVTAPGTPGSITNAASVQTANTDPNLGNNADTEATEVVAAAATPSPSPSPSPSTPASQSPAPSAGVLPDTAGDGQGPASRALGVAVLLAALAAGVVLVTGFRRRNSLSN